jgi:hypothetical protein
LSRIPTLRTSRLRDDDPPRRLGRAGLDSLVRDALNLDGNHPADSRVADMIQSGFELVFAVHDTADEADTVTDPNGPFGRSFAKLVKKSDGFDDLPAKAREDLGRRVIFDALKSAGHELPEGFENDLPQRRRRAIETAQAQSEDDDGRNDKKPHVPTPPRLPQELGLGSTKDNENPWPETPVAREFRDAIHQRESTKDNYQAINTAGGAWGRYQLTKIARKQIRMEDENGKLTGKYGIDSREDFLNNPVAQEKAFADYMKDNKRLLKSNGALSRTGQKIEGIKKNYSDRIWPTGRGTQRRPCRREAIFCSPRGPRLEIHLCGP